MWMFYIISLPLTTSMVMLTLKYFSGPYVPRYVLFTVAYTWFCSLSLIVLVPPDISTTVVGSHNRGIGFFWSWSYWSTFLLTWVVVPLIQGFEDAGDFSLVERLKTSVHMNLLFYFIVGSVGLVGLILFFIMHGKRSGSVFGLAMACSNTFGLVTGAFLLGFGLSEIPKSIWRNADWTTRRKVLSHKIAKMAVKLDDAHQELSNVIVVAQATSKQMSKRDPLRPCMDVIDNMLVQMFQEDPDFKPQGGTLGENDMDYDTDEKSMATLRRHLRRAREEYCRYKRYCVHLLLCITATPVFATYALRQMNSEYMTYVIEALELEDTIKNYERRTAVGWKFISSIRPERNGKLGSLFDTTEFMWRCMLRKYFQKALAIVLGCMSGAILLAEATLLPSGVDLSFFSLLIKSVGKQEVLVQVFAFIPLVYMCVCTYYSLFKVGMMMFYSLTPRQTSSVSLLMICSMVARYAPPVSYNFLNLIQLNGKKTIFEERMGNIDDAVPFFGRGFNKIFPLIMVIYTLLVVSNFFDRVINFFGNWKIFRFQTDAEDTDGFDSSGLLILQKERTWLEQGRELGEHVVPLVRNLNRGNDDIEAGTNITDSGDVETKTTASLLKNTNANVVRKYGGSREAISSKYAAIREQNKQASNFKPDNEIASTKVSLLEPGSSQGSKSTGASSSGLALKWASVKSRFQNFKANIDAKNLIPLRQIQDSQILSRVSSTESLDEIFQKLKRPSVDHESLSDVDEDEIESSSRIRR